MKSSYSGLGCGVAMWGMDLSLVLPVSVRLVGAYSLHNSEENLKLMSRGVNSCSVVSSGGFSLPFLAPV